jgi:hypothetical protein
LNQKTTIAGKKGFWLKLGAVKEFIEWDSEAIVCESSQFSQSIEQLTQKLETK